MSPITMYAAVQIVGDRRRASETTARQRRLGRRAGAGDPQPAAMGRVLWLHGHRRHSEAADRSVA